jgi:ABC-2 type transport system ATP-binding protein
VEKARRDERTRAVAEVCGLFEVLAEPVGQLSKGYRQRVGLAQAMIHDPPILILDEPTSGLDPNQIVEIRELIKAAGREKTVILSSHILPIVEATCTRVILIHRGELVADGAIDEVVQEHSRPRLALQIEGDAQQIVDKLSGVEGVHECTRVGEDVAFQLELGADGDADEVTREVFACVRDNGWSLVGLERRSASLEDVFRKLTAPQDAAA